MSKNKGQTWDQLSVFSRSRLLTYAVSKKPDFSLTLPYGNKVKRLGVI